MDKETLKAAYTRLKKEIIGSIPSISDDSDPASVGGKSLDPIMTEIERLTGISNPMTRKTLMKYLRAEEYDPAWGSIGLLAALWLYNAKLLTREDCRTFYKKSENRNSPHYWNEYLRTVTNETRVEEPGTVPIEETTALYDDLNAVDGLFRMPDMTDPIERTRYLDDLFDRTNRQRLVVVDGISGAGKKSLVKSLQHKLIHSRRYRGVWWKHIDTNYSLDNLISEVSSKVKLNGGLTIRRPEEFVDFLKANELLLVLYGIENAEPSFEYLFKMLSRGTGNAQVLLIRENLTVFEFIESKNRLLIDGYTPEEITRLCEKQNISIPDEVLSDFLRESDGLPFYIDLLIRRYANEDKSDLSNSLLYLEDIEHKIEKEWCSKLTGEEKELLQVLSVFETKFLPHDCHQLSLKIGITNYRQAFKRLQDYHVIRRVSNIEWKVIAPVAEYFREKYNINNIPQLHNIVGDYKSQNLDHRNIRFNKDLLLKQAECISHYHRGGNFLKVNHIFETIIPWLKQHNLYLTLYKLLDFEVKNNVKKDGWKRWHLAHCCLMLSKFDECLSHISKCIDIAFSWYRDNTKTYDRVPFFIKTLQLFSELVARTFSVDEAYKILSYSLSLFEITELEWQLRSHALSVLSFYHEKKEEFSKSEFINKVLLEEEFGGFTRSQAVAHTHLGIVNYHQQKYSTAEEHFLKAKSYFDEVIDLRGSAWSTSYLVLCGIKLERKDLSPLVNRVIGIKGPEQAADEDYNNWLKILLTELNDESLLPVLESAYAHSTEKLRLAAKNIPAGEIEREIRRVMVFFNRRYKKPLEFEALINPFGESNLPPESRLEQSVIRGIRKEPYIYLKRIEEKSIDQIFNSKTNNKILIGCLRFYDYTDDILKRIILPNLDYIISLDKTYDEIKIEYARILHNVGNQDDALRILGSISEENQRFLYLTTKANCLRKKNLEENKTYYELAGIAAETDREKGIHYHNLALVIYESRETEKYEEAKEYCRKSIHLRERDKRFTKHPISTLVLLEIETTDKEDLVSRVSDLKSEYAISNGFLSYIVRKVRNPIKKKVLIHFIDPRSDH